MLESPTYAYKSYSQDEGNISGALLFLSYIVAALYFSIRIWSIIWNRYISIRASLSTTERLRVFISFGLTLLSFAVLSYNMLMFLIVSYNDWAQRHGVNGNPLLQQNLLWRWMSHSTLFEDFARSLVATPARTFWTQIALLQTYQIVNGMYQVLSTHREGLGELIALSQILPVSYTMGLLGLLQTTSERSDTKTVSPRPTQANGVTLGMDAFYLMVVWLLPSFSQATNFMPVVLLVRALLVTPFLVGRSASPFYRRTIYLAGIVALAARAYGSLQINADPIQEIWEALVGHPAVRALGQDALIAICGNVIYTLA